MHVAAFEDAASKSSGCSARTLVLPQQSMNSPNSVRGAAVSSTGVEKAPACEEHARQFVTYIIGKAYEAPFARKIASVNELQFFQPHLARAIVVEMTSQWHQRCPSCGHRCLPYIARAAPDEKPACKLN